MTDLVTHARPPEPMAGVAWWGAGSPW
jgi:hypothetical protein